MFEKMQKLEVSQEELAIIEAALHTQSKMLNVEAAAGGTTALQRLNGVKQVLRMLDDHKPATETTRPSTMCGWLRKPRIAG
jgi:hypothetical protein